MEGRRLHFVGIGGAGMSGLALVARALGADVSGSDRAESSYVERLRAAGIEPAIGHDASNLPDGAEVVVLEAEQRERVVDRDRAQLRVDLVALDVGVVELVEDLAALVRLLAVALVELVMVLHRLLRDAVQLLVEGLELPRLEFVPGHLGSFRSFKCLLCAYPFGLGLVSAPRSGAAPLPS